MSSEISFIQAITTKREMLSLGQYICGVTHRAQVVCMHELCISISQNIQISFHCKINIDSPVLVILT